MHRLTRRAVLRVAGVAAVASTASACGLLRDDPPPPPDALVPLLASTLALVADYDAVMQTLPQLGARLTPLADAHRVHAQEIYDLMGLASPSATPAPNPSRSVPADPAGAVTGLRTAEQALAKTATEACLAAPAERAPILGSIAACLATHAEVLK